MSEVKRRVKELEKATRSGDQIPVYVVCWDNPPPPPEPGVKVVTWDDIELEEDNEQPESKNHPA